MNVMGLVPSKGVTLTLHRIHCVHTLMNVRKMKFIFYIYTIFIPYNLYRFCSLFGKFLSKSCKISCQEKLLNDMLTNHVTQPSQRHFEHYVGQSTISFIYDVAYA